MVKDEDTTPVALRAALLRDGKTRVRAKATKSSILWRLSNPRGAKVADGGKIGGLSIPIRTRVMSTGCC